MAINYAGHGMNGHTQYEIHKPPMFNWSEATIIPDYIHYRDAVFGQHLNGYPGVVLVTKSAVETHYGKPDCELEVYDKRGLIGRNSGISGLYLALEKAYNPIYLMGYDYWADGHGCHFYTDETCVEWQHMPGQDKDITCRKYLPNLADFGVIRTTYPDVDIYNCSPVSMLETFPYMPIDEVLNGL